MDFLSALKKLTGIEKPILNPAADTQGNPEEVMGVKRTYGQNYYNQLYKQFKGVEPKTAPATPTPTPDVRQWDNFKKYIANESLKRGYDPGAVVSQKAIESARGTSDFAKNRFNYGGIGAYDADPNQAFSFKSPEDYTNYYFKMIEKRFPKAYAVRGNAQSYAEELKKANYATDPDYVWKILNTPEFREYGRKQLQAQR